MQPVLEIDGLVKRYGRIDALAGVSLSIGAGETYAFLGRNGAGKSTTIRTIMGITKPTGGNVTLFGERLTARSQVRLRQKIGYVAQEQTFYPWMSADTLGRFVGAFFPTWDRAEFERLLHLLDVPRDRKVGTFSGGTKAKLALSLALAHRPGLLLLDEPTAGLDPVARREFLDTVATQTTERGTTTLFSTHLIDEVEVAAHRVGIVDRGRMRFDGPLESLRARFRLLAHDGSLPDAPIPSALLDPAGFRVHNERVAAGRRRILVEAADPARFVELATEGWALEALPLEELFIEMVRRPG